MNFSKLLNLLLLLWTLLLHLPFPISDIFISRCLLRPHSPQFTGLPGIWPCVSLAPHPQGLQQECARRLSATVKLSGKHVSSAASENAAPLNNC